MFTEAKDYGLKKILTYFSQIDVLTGLALCFKRIWCWIAHLPSNIITLLSACMFAIVDVAGENTDKDGDSDEENDEDGVKVRCW